MYVRRWIAREKLMGEKKVCANAFGLYGDDID
jgi:hypothetical protein